MKQLYKFLMGLLILGVISCKKDQPEVEYSPLFPISGEWHTHVFNEDGTSASNSVYAMRTYNTSDNLSDIAWIRLANEGQPFGVLAKVKVDVSSKTFVKGSYENTLPVAADKKSITLIEGKVLLDASTQPSKAVADSIYVKYKTGVNGKTYVIKGHRRTGWPEDVY